MLGLRLVVRRGDPDLARAADAALAKVAGDVAWNATVPAPVAPLLPRLSRGAKGRHRGAALRFGLVEVPPADLEAVAVAMGVLPEFAGSAVV